MSDELDHLGTAQHKDELLLLKILEERKEEQGWVCAWLNKETGQITVANGHSRANALAKAPLDAPCAIWRFQDGGKLILHDHYNCDDDTVAEMACKALLPTS